MKENSDKAHYYCSERGDSGMKMQNKVILFPTCYTVCFYGA